MGKRFDSLKEKWDMGWITEETLRKWVLLNIEYPGEGISKEEFKQIVGKVFE